jgi:hypothetical protein
MLTLEKHRLYDLKIQLSLLPQLGYGKIGQVYAGQAECGWNERFPPASRRGRKALPPRRSGQAPSSREPSSRFGRSTPRLRQSFIEQLPHIASPAAIHHRKAVNIGLLGDGGPRRAGLSASNARDRREQCYRANELDLFPKRHVQMTTPHLNHFGVVAGLDADQSSARPRGSCFCWHAEPKINDRTSASLRPQDVTNIRGIWAQSRGAA